MADPYALTPGMRAALDQTRAHLADAQDDLRLYSIACGVIDGLEHSKTFAFTPKFARILALELVDRYGDDQPDQQPRRTP